MTGQIDPNFLKGPGPKVKVNRLDFGEIGIPGYRGNYAVVLDNCLSKEECNQLLQAAESTSGGVWERAMVNTGNYEQELITDIRNCGRIIWDSPEMVDRIWMRIAPHVPEILEVSGNSRVTGEGPVKRKEKMVMTRLNERMRFLKYTGGEYFKAHCDGSYVTRDGSERSLYTLHLYLNEKDESNNLVGGATTFHSMFVGDQPDYDVDPKVGRVLLFQHRHLCHSGQDVETGVKYTMRTDLMFRTQGTVDKSL